MYLTDYSRNAATAQRMRKLIQRRGVNPQGSPLWTDEEDDACKRLYPDYKALQQALPRRAQSAIQKRCGFLGIQNKVHIWTAKESFDLRRMYRSADSFALRDRFPHVSKAALRMKARSLGVYRHKKPYQATGDTLLDALRARAHAEGPTMSHLDEFVNGRGYFRTMRWIGRQPDYIKIARAIQQLGATLSVTWDAEQ